MGNVELITQLSSGELVLGVLGERIVGHYSFYAVFKTPEEYRVLIGNKSLGTLPIDSLVMEGQHIIFSGRRWKVVDVDSEKKVIRVEKTKGGKPPKFGGEGMSIHNKVRQEMFKILCEGDYRISVGNHKVDFIDGKAKELFDEAVDYFNHANLKQISIIQHGNSTCIFTWMGDKVINTLVALLTQKGFEAGAYAGVIEVEKSDVNSIEVCLTELSQQSYSSNTELAELVIEKKIEKYDEFLPDELLNVGYGYRAFDIEETLSWIKNVTL